jgi:hypothetical protein
VVGVTSVDEGQGLFGIEPDRFIVVGDRAVVVALFVIDGSAIAVVGRLIASFRFPGIDNLGAGSLIRIVKGIMAINESRPIANPSSWLFGAGAMPAAADLPGARPAGLSITSDLPQLADVHRAGRHRSKVPNSSLRQAAVVGFGPAIFDRDILAIDVAGFAQPLLKCRHAFRKRKSIAI